MATEKSVIEIDVLDDKFKAFAEIFDKFQKTLDDMPNKWLDVNKAITTSNEKAKKAQKELERAQKQLNKDLRDGEQLIKNTAKFSYEIAKNFGSAAISIAKWVSLGALGGGFGLGALAASTSDYRKRSQRLGVTTGDLRAAEVNFDKYFDTDAVLANIAHLQSDLTKRGLLNRLGGNTSQTPTEMLPTIIRNAIDQFNQGGRTEQYANTLGLTDVFGDIETLRLLAGLKQELETTIQQFQADRPKLSNTDEENKKVQAFWTSLNDAKMKLESELIGPLSDLAKPLGELTKAFTDAVVAFLKSKELKDAIKEFTDWIGSDGAKQTLADFFKALEGLTDVVLALTALLPDLSKPKDTPKGQRGRNGYTYKNGVIDNTDPENYVGGTTWWGRILNSQNPAYQKAIAGKKTSEGAITPKPNAAAAAVDKVVADAYAQGYKNERYSFGFKRGTPSEEALLRQTEQLNGLPKGILSQLRQVESSGNNLAVSSKGAMGPFGFMPRTAKEFDLADPFNLKDSAAAAAKKLQGLIRHYMGNLEYALEAYNWGEGNMDAYLKTGRGARGRPMPAETAAYANKILVTVTNAAGTDLNTATNAMR